MLGILSSMIENMSKQAIEVANSSSSNNAKVIKYFTDKVTAWMKYSEMKFSSIGKSTENKECFMKLNEILSAMSLLTKKRMENAKALAEFL